ncbi:hypothetical protein GCM10009579_18080 [Streptomyces javensis]|uniref:Uncharacterized protein n=1 Tax=Streptomyces javensis TaxID=114698 RepID=A0ABN1WST7_9ACTN
MERLSDACRNGHPVLAVVRGSAINQDGASTPAPGIRGPGAEPLVTGRGGSLPYLPAPTAPI